MYEVNIVKSGFWDRHLGLRQPQVIQFALTSHSLHASVFTYVCTTFSLLEV